MAIIIRRWYSYNGTSGGQLSATNYFFDANIDPDIDCGTPANNICAVKGIYSITTFGSGTITYGTNPKTFNDDPMLESYIIGAFGSGLPFPASGQKPYVYVRTI